jgi:3-hydroxybutyryl-CoA dehydrogenase
MNLDPSVCVVGICGIGQMGASAAVCFSRAGYDVSLWARDPQKLTAIEPELTSLHAFLEKHVGPPRGATGTINPTSDFSSIDESANVILECVTEDLGQKADLLSRLKSAAERKALILSTTSGLSITEMGRRGGIGGLLVGAHFWNPAHLMPIVEVIRGDDTPDDRMDTTVELIDRIGKIPVRVEKDVPGFIGNRLQHAMWREALHLIESGIATPEDVDLVASQTFGLRLPAIGPCANMDLVGLPLVAQVQSYLLADLSNACGVMPAVRERLDAGRLGMRTERGFYDWKRRDPVDMASRRDRQIVNQLKFLRTLDDPRDER